jgi:SSS family solute:Na+ symporter
MLLFGMLVSVMMIALLAVYSGLHKKKGGKLNSALVSGVILGTYLGGSGTIGTSQLAFVYGNSAWCFHAGGLLGFLFLYFVYGRPIRRTGKPTVVGIIGEEYGPRTGLVASVLNALGNFIAILSQLIAGTSVIAVVAPELPLAWSFVSVALLMGIYVVFGGTKGAGMVGLLKLFLVLLSLVTCGIAALWLSGGAASFMQGVEQLNRTHAVDFFSFFNRGVGKDFGALFSVMIGVATSQIYAQAIINAGSDREARRGVLLSAMTLPVVGACAIAVGLYMRMHFPDIEAKAALTEFVLIHLPAFPAGVVLGTLLITVVGSGAGIALGVATIFNYDIARRLFPVLSRDGRDELRVRVFILVLLAVAVSLCLASRDDMILNYSVLSMGLRASVTLVPLSFALWLKGRVRAEYALLCVVLCPAAVVALIAYGSLPIDPMVVGILLGGVVMGAGLLRSSRAD